MCLFVGWGLGGNICVDDIEQAEQILETRKMNQTRLADQSTLLDLLEIHQLRKGKFDILFQCKLFFLQAPELAAPAPSFLSTPESL